MPEAPYIKNWKFNRRQEPVILVSTFLIILIAVTTVLNFGWLTVALLILISTAWILILYFFRDPDRVPLAQPGLVVGPGDGEVVSINKVKEVRYLNMETIQISIFLSVFDVHVQRSPLAGVVDKVDHQPGKFLQAFRPEASDVNEYIAMQIDTPYGKILVKQIAGILARRCINYAQVGDQLKSGQRYGHIKFGSRVDLFLPPQAEVQIKVGDKVYGGLTPIAQLHFQNNEKSQP